MLKKTSLLITLVALAGCSSSNPQVEYCQGFECQKNHPPTWGNKTPTSASPETKGISISGDW